MTAKFFGQWLIERKKLEPEQLLEATNYQSENNISLGDAAIELGYLNASQIQMINLDQQRKDKRFGEIALEHGLISELQLSELLALQKKRNIFLGEAITKLGLLSDDEVEAELEEHQRSQREHEKLLSVNFDNVHDDECVRAFVDMTVKLFTRIVQDVTKIDSVNNVSVSTSSRRTFIQKVKGDKEFYFFLSLQDDLQIQIASKLMMMEQSDINEIVLDACREFVNIVTGNGCVKLSEQGFSVELDPTSILEADSTLPAHFHAVVAEANSTKGDFSVGFLFQ